jgi:hypothetical protein
MACCDEGGGKPVRLLLQLVGRIIIRRYESTRWRVTPSALTRRTVSVRLHRERAELQTDSPDGQNLFNFSDDRFGHRALSLPNRVRVNRNLLRRFNPIWVVSSPRANILLSENRNCVLFPRSRLGKRGVRVVTNVGRDAVDALATQDERC